MHRSTPAMQSPPAPSPYHQRSFSQTHIASPSSPPPSSARSRRPSLSTTMHWLSRTPPPASTTVSASYTPAAKPVKISEPKRVRGIDALPRSGTLGAGATVVRTPDEALRETGVRLVPEPVDPGRASPAGSQADNKIDSESPGTPHHSYHAPTDASASPPMSPTSPPLPPLPLPVDTDEETLNEPDSPTEPKAPPRPSRTPPPPPTLRPLSARSSLKVRTTSAAVDAPTVPPLPAHIVASTQPPPFHAILVSDPPSLGVDASKVIVTIETCTATHKTSLATIHSRPSHLSKYLSRLVPQAGQTSSMASSIYSTNTESDDLETYRRHLTSQGLIPQSCNVHIFLDRPSFAYSYILNFLRMPAIDGQADFLPRTLQLHGPGASAPQARLDDLIEVREEAAFLGLDALHRLCSDEIRLRYGPRLHVRGQSSLSSSGASVHSMQASVCGVHPLRAEHGDVPPSPLTGSSTLAASPPPVFMEVSDKLPPAPEGPHSGSSLLPATRNPPRQSVKSPPAGWI